MFDASFRLYFRGHLPSGFQSLVPSQCVVEQWDNSIWTALIDSPAIRNSGPFAELLRLLRSRLLAPCSIFACLVDATSFRTVDRYEELFDRDGIIAFEVLPDDLVGCGNATSDFSPPLPPPCNGIVPMATPLVVRERPKGHVAEAQKNILFSVPFAEAIAKVLPEHETGLVFLRGERLQNWCRIGSCRFCAILARESVEKGVCARCGSSGQWNIGFWLGRRPSGFVGGFDALGHEEMGIVHPLVVSQEFANELLDQFGTGYGLLPVVDIESSTGRMIREVLNAIQTLGRVPAHSTSSGVVAEPG